MNTYQSHIQTQGIQGTSTLGGYLCAWTCVTENRVDQISTPVAGKSIALNMVKDFAHDPGGSDG